jgi:hypothetical protein
VNRFGARPDAWFAVERRASPLVGAAADLRRRLPANLEYLDAVLEDALSPDTPAFDEISFVPTRHLLHAYLVHNAWDAYEDGNH